MMRPAELTHPFDPQQTQPGPAVRPGVKVEAPKTTRAATKKPKASKRAQPPRPPSPDPDSRWIRGDDDAPERTQVSVWLSRVSTTVLLPKTTPLSPPAPQADTKEDARVESVSVSVTVGVDEDLEVDDGSLAAKGVPAEEEGKVADDGGVTEHTAPPSPTPTGEAECGVPPPPAPDSAKKGWARFSCIPSLRSSCQS